MKILEISPNLYGYVQRGLQIGSRHNLKYWALPVDFKKYILRRGTLKIKKDIKDKNIVLLIFSDDNILIHVLTDINVDNFFEKYITLL